jgi:hypothetical protein
MVYTVGGDKIDEKNRGSEQKIKNSWVRVNLIKNK